MISLHVGDSWFIQQIKDYRRYSDGRQPAAIVCITCSREFDSRIERKSLQAA